jgi:cytochrome c-type biogenesis protein CcmH/NrfG
VADADLAALVEESDALREQMDFGERAIEVNRRILELDPARLVTWVRLAHAMQRQERWPEAAEAWQGALRAQPDSEVAAQALAAVRDRAAAYEELDSAGGHAQLIAIGLRARERGDDRLWRQAFERAVALLREWKGYDEVIAIAKGLADGELYEVALPLFEHACTLRPSAPSYVMLGKNARVAGDLERSERAYRRALELDPSSSYAKIGLGATLRRAQRPTEAEALARTVLEKAPNDTYAMNLLGAALIDQGKPEGAECFARVLELGGTVPREHMITLQQLIVESGIQGHEESQRRLEVVLEALKAASKRRTH